MDAFFELIEKFIVDNQVTEKKIYLVIDGSNQEEKEMASSLLYWSRLNSNKLRIKGLEGILLYGGRRYWPLTIPEEDKKGSYLKININIFARFMKEVHSEEIEAKEETPEESIQQTKEVVKTLYQTHKQRLESASGSSEKVIRKSDEIEEDPIELIKAEVTRNKHLPGKSFEEKLSNLFKENKKPEATKKLKATGQQPATKKQPEKTEKKIEKTIKDITTHLVELNKKYNGVVEINEKSIDRASKNFYKPLDIVGFKDFSAYKKQETEFGDNLDQAMFDLLKSIEMDKDLDIRVLNIQTKITDTNRDRLKTYKIKIQHKKFGHTKPYTISLHVPIPSKGKYLKIGGNDYIMINQFYSKPVIKVSPKMVRVYTQWATCSVSLKHHSLNDTEGFKDTLHNLSLTLKHAKKLKKTPQKLENDEIDSIIKKWDLPENIDPEVFVNFEIKD